MLCLWYIVWSLHKAYWDILWTNDSDDTSKTIIESDVVRIIFRMFKFSSKRKDSAIRTLVAETLVLAKTHGYVEKIEHELEEELQRENTEPPNKILAKWRRNGEKLLKNKYTLLTVALFCVTECALILGELILDLHKVKGVLEDQENAGTDFVKKLSTLYPDRISSNGTIASIYEQILRSKIKWVDLPVTNHTSLRYSSNRDNETRHIRAAGGQHIMSMLVPYVNHSGYTTTTDIGSPGLVSHNKESHADANHGVGLEEAIAKAFHKASITILSILVFQTILKALCAGTAFFTRKLETFDLCIVLISFVVDLVCMKIMPDFEIQDFVFVLAFLLPWRVIRVVNSLVVAVQDHEHFRLKLIYGRKKKIVNSLRESEIKLQLFRAQCNALKRLCFNEGIDESKIDQILMVEECVVNKTGKNKSKIKIDNSSVIVLNDKSDFPRLSPRPSLLNLVDKVGRRKSMQPPVAPNIDRDLITTAKDSPKKGILKFRARSNSESGRGTLSSPDDGLFHQNGIGDMGAYSGLSTPLVINRKSSLTSPIMANHVRNILNCLEDRVNQMNGSCSRASGGRGSIDAESIAEEVEDTRPARRFGRRVHSIDETTELSSEREYKMVSRASKRRASLQPQRCVDEDDIELCAIKILAIPSSRLTPTSPNREMGSGHSTSTETKAVIEVPGSSTILHSPRLTPTTIQIDPPSYYSLSSSNSSNSNSSKKYTSVDQPLLGTNPLQIITNNNKKPPMSSKVVPHTTYASEAHISKLHGTEEANQPQEFLKTTSSLKAKTIRTPSDVENQNNITPSDSSDVCGSQSNDADTRNTSIDEIEDYFDNSETMLTISNTDDSVLSGTSCQPSTRQTYVTADIRQPMDGATTIISKPSASKEINGSAGKSSKTSKDGNVYSPVKCPTSDLLDSDMKSDSVSNLLS